MTGSQWQTVGVIAAIIFSAITAYYLARAQTREAQRLNTEARDKAVKDATDPLNERIREQAKTIRDRDARIEALEDELRREHRR